MSDSITEKAPQTPESQNRDTLKITAVVKTKSLAVWLPVSEWFK